MKDKSEEMLQRAAGNAYSWWWASHIRTKQSKWLEQNLQDMEEKVEYVLSLIQEDGDSFAKRAEMYYKKRPELIFFVEDSFRAFKALADRYDHLSSEMQNANNTLATCLPEQFQLPMDEDDEYEIKTPRTPKVPRLSEDLKGLVQKRFKELHNKKLSNESDLKVAKSGLCKSEAIEEIDRLQKDILELQTVKEYVKSSYQSGLEKFFSIENAIMDKQQKVCNLQDEFDIDKVIEDDQARRLMAEAALKSCRETLAELEEIQQKSVTETKEDREKIEYAGQRIKNIREQCLHEQTYGEEKTFYENNDSIRTGEMTPSSCIDLGNIIPEKMKQQFDMSSMSSITVTELADKIDELVNKMINLQSSVSSQTAQIDRLTAEANELHEHIRTLEDDKATLTEGTHDLENKVKELQEELTEVQILNKNVESVNSKLETRFAEAQSSLDLITEKLSHVKADEEVTTSDSTQVKTSPEDDSNTHEDKVNQKHLSSEDKENYVLSKIDDAIINNTHEDDLHWAMMLLNGEEHKEDILLREYTIILKNYKHVKRKLNAMERKEKNMDTEQITELRLSIAKRDEGIQYLRRKLIRLQRKLADTMNTNADESSTLSPSDYKKIKDITLEEGNTYCTTEEDNYFKSLLSDQNVGISPVEEELRTDIDTILDENLDFWLRFSTSFHQIQKFKTMVEDLQGEISLIKRQQENKASNSAKTVVRPIYIHLKEIEAELRTWLKQSAKLKHEVDRRASLLFDIQEKLNHALKEGVQGEEVKLSSHRAAKFQGEIMNMKQENDKVSEELQAGDEHITSIQDEVDRTLTKLNQEFGISPDIQSPGTPTRSKIPLRAFIFGAKTKKQSSIFSCIHPNMRI